MFVLVDTCIWSLALCRSNDKDPLHVNELSALISEHRVHLIGPIRQELLSGITATQQFNLLRQKLRAFPDFNLSSEDYEKAAEYCNKLRAKGIQGSMTDFLICAVAIRSKMAIYTYDNDFLHFKLHIPIALHQPRQ